MMRRHACVRSVVAVGCAACASDPSSPTERPGPSTVSFSFSGVRQGSCAVQGTPQRVDENTIASTEYGTAVTYPNEPTRAGTVSILAGASEPTRIRGTFRASAQEYVGINLSPQRTLTIMNGRFDVAVDDPARPIFVADCSSARHQRQRMLGPLLSPTPRGRQTQQRSLDAPPKSGCRITGRVGMEYLDRDVAIVPQVVGTIDGGHPPSPQLAHEVIAVSQRGAEAFHGLEHTPPAVTSASVLGWLVHPGQRSGGRPWDPAVAYIYVEDVASKLAEIEAGSGTRLGDAMSMPRMGTFGYFTDPSGTNKGLIGS